jgi:hypothetical protein
MRRVITVVDCDRPWLLLGPTANRTLLRAKGQLGVQSKEMRENNQNVWYWSLPDLKSTKSDPSEYPADGKALPATPEQRRQLDEVLKL